MRYVKVTAAQADAERQVEFINIAQMVSAHVDEEGTWFIQASDNSLYGPYKETPEKLLA